MSEQIKQIAERLKGLREIENISIEEMAQKIGVDCQTYKRYEEATTDIPVSFLYEVAGVFGIELTALLSGDGPKLKVFQMTKADKGLNVERRKQYKYQNLAYNFIHKKSEPFLVVAPSENSDKELELNSHPGQEFDYVIEGSIEIIISDKKMILNEGDSIYYDSIAPHAMRAIGGKDAKFLAIIM